MIGRIEWIIIRLPDVLGCPEQNREEAKCTVTT